MDHVSGQEPGSKLPISQQQLAVPVPVIVQLQGVPTVDSWKIFDFHDSDTIHKVQQTHKPDGSNNVNFNHVFTITRRILLQENGCDAPSKLQVPASIINKLSCEIACKCSGRDAHATTMMLLESLLANYSWDAKLAVTVAAFAMNYGEFYLLVHLYSSNPIAKNIALMKQLQGLIEDTNSSGLLFLSIAKLVGEIMNVMKCVAEFIDVTPDLFAKPLISTAKIDIARAVYWTIYSVVTCGSYIASLVGLTQPITIRKMGLELSELASKLSSIQTLLQRQFEHWREELDSHMLLEIIFKKPCRDNLEILRALFSHDEGGEQKSSLVVGNTMAEVEIKELEDKKLLLLISDYDVRAEEIRGVVKLIENLSKEGKFQYEVIWVPVVSEQNEQKFALLQSLMPWYTVQKPSVIKSGAIKYIKEVWKFHNEAILVPLYLSGSAPSPLPLAYLIVVGKLPAQCEPPSLGRITLDKIICDLYPVEPAKPNSVRCFYGGEDIKWIGDFLNAINGVKGFIDFVYVSNSNIIHQTSKAISDLVAGKNIGVYWEQSNSCLFWTKLEYTSSPVIIQEMKVDTMKDILTLLSFNGNYGGWAVFREMGSTQKLITAPGEVILDIFSSTSKWWNGDASVSNFLPALTHQIETSKAKIPHHCHHIVLPPKVEKIPEEFMTCAYCGCKMSKQLIYRCCV